ncbi:hypothetical protein [Paraflavitalea pollutisoli]|uniref:hypothetical protein n=1 Tax=Paraflavitalea pollutisoli TaxID=3034143 RepID=UPI0023EC36AB|nr:hypothetical protein [Paraflavitalea sp. H1-2-19X]
MMKKTFVVAVLLTAIIACQQADRIARRFLNPDRLPSQFFTVDITKATILVTAKRAVIKLPKGATTQQFTLTLTAVSNRHWKNNWHS